MSEYKTANNSYNSQVSLPSYSPPSDGRPAGCCGRGCCWWGKKKLGLE